jgi:hypothetical protein
MNYAAAYRSIARILCEAGQLADSVSDIELAKMLRAIEAVIINRLYSTGEKKKARVVTEVLRRRS